MSILRALTCAVAGLACVSAFDPAVAGPMLATPAIGMDAPAIQTVQYLPGSGFQYPKMRGAIVDWCSTWSTDCGPGGATLFCRQQGFPGAIGWEIFQPGRTYVIGSDRFCEADFCKGYSFIRCG